jgi:putative DNA primase/helicase
MEVIKFVQRVLGYSLSGSCKEQKMFILCGGGRNGKSTLVNAILDVFGDYGKQSPADLLMASKYDRHPTELAGLKGVRFLGASETSEGRWLNEARVKNMTGEDKITARFMRQNFFTYTPEYKIFLTTNHKPNIRCGDLGIQRRLVLIPFNYTVPEDEIDKSLPGTLKGEAPGIFNWLLKGFAMWNKHGLDIPAEILTATEEYIKDHDFIATFIEERCQVEGHFRIPVSELYEAYKIWAGQTGEPYLTRRRFKELLLDYGFEQKNNGGRYWVGLKLAPL